MRTFTTTSPRFLPSFLFCSALEAGLLPACSAGSVKVGTDYSGGSTSFTGSTGGNGGATSVNVNGGSVSIGGANENAGAGNQDQSLLSTGDSNAVRSGGYWWTYTDHNPIGSPYHATVSPKTDMVTALPPAKDSDPGHGNVLRISGAVPPPLPWNLVSIQDPTSIDTYWQSMYPDSMIPAYPEAEIGFGFRANNAPFDATGGGKYVGIAFDMKLNDASMTTLFVSFPMDGTDLPDPNFNDAFPTFHCKYYTAANTPVTGYQTCFTHYRKGFHTANMAYNAYGEFADAGVWKRYCVLYSEVGIPTWANTGIMENMPAFDPTKLLKVRWDMFQPADGAPAARFDISLDNVQLLTDAGALDASNNCDPAMIGQPPGTGGEG